MCCPFRAPAATFHAIVTFLALCTAVACGGASGAAGTSGANAPIGIEVSQTFVTLENRTGGPLVEAQVEITPLGILPPFKTVVPRLETGARSEVTFNSFRGADGSPFSRQITRAKNVKVTAKDLTGKVYESEAPFN